MTPLTKTWIVEH